MMAILDRRFGGLVNSDDLRVELEAGAVPVATEWLVIVRRETLRSWEGPGRPAFSTNTRIVDFGAIVEAYGGEHAFNDLVHELLDFNFYREWIANG